MKFLFLRMMFNGPFFIMELVVHLSTYKSKWQKLLQCKGKTGKCAVVGEHTHFSRGLTIQMLKFAASHLFTPSHMMPMSSLKIYSFSCHFTKLALTLFSCNGLGWL
jgi:hypothetical protein